MRDTVVNGQPDSPTDGLLSVGISEAAKRLGISVEGVRKRIKRGQLRAYKQDGETWRIVLPSDLGPLSAQPSGPMSGLTPLPSRVGPSGPTSGQTSSDLSTQPSAPDGVSPDQLTAALRLAETLAGQLAGERERSAMLIAEERERVAELERERAELFGRLGYFQAELETARKQIKLLEAPKAQLEASPAPRHPWWQFWRGTAPSTSRA